MKKEEGTIIVPSSIGRRDATNKVPMETACRWFTKLRPFIALADKTCYGSTVFQWSKPREPYHEESGEEVYPRRIRFNEFCIAYGIDPTGEFTEDEEYTNRRRSLAGRSIAERSQ